MEHFNVSVVCHGQTPIMPCEDGSDPYAEPKRQNKFKLLDSGNDMTTEKIVERIILHRYALLSKINTYFIIFIRFILEIPSYNYIFYFYNFMYFANDCLFDC